MAAGTLFISVLFIQALSFVAADDYRLPTVASPSFYQVHINISRDFFANASNAFSGAVVVQLTVANETTKLSLHSSYNFITIEGITLNNNEIPVSDYSVNSTTDILTIDYAAGLTPGTQYALKIVYTSRLSTTDMYGFYKSSYVEGDGVTKYLATTQFESTYARRAFPCWDEPSFKAIFEILITYPSELNVLSNTIGTVQQTDTNTNLRTIQFQQTPAMSTYLVAFIVSEFSCTPGENIDSAPSRVCSRHETADLREWAVEVSPKIMKKFDEYTQFNYSRSMPKMDQVAIPDFAAGAMENWGLVTYRETGLLWDPEESSNSYKQSIAAVIAHEFTHSWFGNLVTCNWWSETFLNEGFARLLQYDILHEVLPEWELTKQFVVLVLQPVFDTDSYLTSQPLQSPASTPSEISAKFGTISYSKGASVLRMVRSILGADNFRDGIRQYLIDYQYSTAVPNQLWTSLSAFVDTTWTDSNVSLNTIMQNWIEKSGYPLVTVSLSGRNVLISQERFLLSGRDADSKWYVPISFTTSADANPFENTAPEIWLTPTQDVSIALPANADWILLNNQATGYYRVNYDTVIWENITRALLEPDFSGIPELNRAQIVNDVFTLAKVDRIDYSRVFRIIEFLKNDVSYFSWYPAFNGFDFLLGRIGQTSLLGRGIVLHLSNLMENLALSVPITKLNHTDHLYTTNQVRTITWACRLGKQDCISGVTAMFNQYKQNLVKPDKNLRSIVYCNALRYSTDSTDWEFLWQRYLATDIATERATLITALGCTQNSTLLNEYLRKSITPDSGIRSQDSYSVYSAVYSGNAIGVDVAFDFLIENYENIDNYYQSMNALSNLISGIASKFTSQEQVDQLRKFVDTSDLTDTFRDAALQALESAVANLNWIDQYKYDLFDYYRLEEEDVVDENESTLPEYRISPNFIPSHYEIHLNVTAEAFTANGNTFSGTVVIHFDITRHTFVIPLHASSQNIVVNTITLNNQEIPSANYSVNPTTDILRINLENSIRPTTHYIMRIEYTGTFGSNNRGFYKSSYLNAEGVRKWLLTTQFEPTHARRAFPCFDEPSFKATFQVLITYPTELVPTSNTRGRTEGSTNPFTGQSTIQFNKTPKMSTYLLAFVVSDFTCTSGAENGSVPYQVCSRDDERDYREWAVDVGPKLLLSLSKFTDYNYSNVMEKMDQFAIPDFASGAMENWGLVTYRESYLLWDPLESSNAYKQSIFTVIAHEFAHQWFGNLVTCSWWSEIFLNEGFASYFEFYSAHDVLPDWELDKQFVVRIHQPVLNTDSYLTSQALQSPASTPTQISNKFGSISYNKGGSILRMVEHIMGTENYRTGLHNYLVANQFRGAKPEDLWASLSETIDNSTSLLPADLETIMENWIKKSGYPILFVNIVNDTVVISQQRFLVSGEDTTSKWYVPVSYTTSLDNNKFINTAPRGWLTPTSDLVINWPAGADWIILNNQESAFYRIQYQDSLWDAIGTALRAENFSGIPDLNRAQIVDDLFDFTKIDLLPYSRTFRVLEFLENDVSYFTWYSVATEFNTLFSRVGQSTLIGRAIWNHVLQLITNMYRSVPLSQLDEDNQLYTLRQILAVTLACRLGQEDCVSHITDVFNAYRVNGVSPPKNLRSVVYCNGLRHSNQKSDWEFIWNSYVTTDLDSERSTLLSSLGCTTDETLLRELLIRSISNSSGIRSGDTLSAFAAVYGNHIGVDVALQFLIENFTAIEQSVQTVTSIGSIIIGIADQIRTEQQRNSFTAFVSSGQLNSQLESIANQSIPVIEENLDWIATYKDDFYEYFGLEDPVPTSSTVTPPTTTSTPATTPSTTVPTTTEPGDGSSAINASLLLTLVLVFATKWYLI